MEAREGSDVVAPVADVRPILAEAQPRRSLELSDHRRNGTPVYRDRRGTVEPVAPAPSRPR